MSIARTVAHEVRCSSSWTSKSSGFSVISSASRRTAFPIVRTPSMDVGLSPNSYGRRLRQELAARSRAGDRVVARPRSGERGEDLLERGAPDLALAGGGESELAVALLDDLVFLEGASELVEVDRGVDHAALLEVLHPLERLLDVASSLEHELEEELRQLLVGEELPEEVGGIVAVPVTHAAAFYGRASSSPGLRAVLPLHVEPVVVREGFSDDLLQVLQPLRGALSLAFVGERLPAPDPLPEEQAHGTPKTRGEELGGEIE